MGASDRGSYLARRARSLGGLCPHGIREDWLCESAVRDPRIPSFSRRAFRPAISFWPDRRPGPLPGKFFRSVDAGDVFEPRGDAIAVAIDSRMAMKWVFQPGRGQQSAKLG